MRNITLLAILLFVLLAIATTAEGKKGKKQHGKGLTKVITKKKDASKNKFKFHHGRKHGGRHFSLKKTAFYFCKKFANCPGPVSPKRLHNIHRQKCCLKCVQKKNNKKQRKIFFQLRAETFDCLNKCNKCPHFKG